MADEADDACDFRIKRRRLGGGVSKASSQSRYQSIADGGCFSGLISDDRIAKRSEEPDLSIEFWRLL